MESLDMEIRIVLGLSGVMVIAMMAMAIGEDSKWRWILAIGQLLFTVIIAVIVVTLISFCFGVAFGWISI